MKTVYILLIILILQNISLSHSLSNSETTPTNPLSFRITQCLGKEEERLHLPTSNKDFLSLNQQVISLFLNLPNITLKDEHFKMLCSNPIESNINGVTEKILEILFLHFENSFKWVTKEKMHKPVLESDINELLSKLPDLFNNYYLVVQKNAPTVDCLEKHIPDLSSFLIEIKYLSQEIPFQLIAQRQNHLKIILEAFKKRDQIYLECKKELTNQKNKKAPLDKI